MRTSSVISPSPSTVAAPTSQMVLVHFDLSSCANINKCFQLILTLTLSVAETSMADDYHLDQSDGKRYSMDPGESAFSSISSSYSPKSSYGFRSSQQFSNGSASMSMCRQSSTSPSTFPESNRTGEEPWGEKQNKMVSEFISQTYEK